MRLEQGDGHQRVQRWRRVGPYHSERFVTLGTLPDGGWFVHDTGAPLETFDNEASARAWVRELIGDGWVETPANLDASQQPVPPEGWVFRGGYWVRR